jgi:hypothetical protein
MELRPRRFRAKKGQLREELPFCRHLNRDGLGQLLPAYGK